MPEQSTNGNQQVLSAISRMRLLLGSLIDEMELMGGGPLVPIETLFEDTNQLNFFEEVTRFEVGLIKAALARTKGNQVHAARLLSLSLSTLNTKIKKYRIGYHSFKQPQQTRALNQMNLKIKL